MISAKVILSVPCCQHEINQQIKCKELDTVLRYGLLKERISALLTDGLRAELLECHGYKTQILEFIDMEHTPKNILIRAVKQANGKKKDTKDYEKLEFMGDAVFQLVCAELIYNTYPEKTEGELTKLRSKLKH